MDFEKEEHNKKFFEFIRKEMNLFNRVRAYLQYRSMKKLDIKKETFEYGNYLTIYGIAPANGWLYYSTVKVKGNIEYAGDPEFYKDIEDLLAESALNDFWEAEDELTACSECDGDYFKEKNSDLGSGPVNPIKDEIDLYHEATSQWKSINDRIAALTIKGNEILHGI